MIICWVVNNTDSQSNKSQRWHLTLPFIQPHRTSFSFLLKLSDTLYQAVNHLWLKFQPFYEFCSVVENISHIFRICTLYRMIQGLMRIWLTKRVLVCDWLAESGATVPVIGPSPFLLPISPGHVHLHVPNRLRKTPLQPTTHFRRRTTDESARHERLKDRLPSAKSSTKKGGILRPNNGTGYRSCWRGVTDFDRWH